MFLLSSDLGQRVVWPAYITSLSFSSVIPASNKTVLPVSGSKHSLQLLSETAISFFYSKNSILLSPAAESTMCLFAFSPPRPKKPSSRSTPPVSSPTPSSMNINIPEDLSISLNTPSGPLPFGFSTHPYFPPQQFSQPFGSTTYSTTYQASSGVVPMIDSYSQRERERERESHRETPTPQPARSHAAELVAAVEEHMSVTSRIRAAALGPAPAPAASPATSTSNSSSTSSSGNNSSATSLADEEMRGLLREQNGYLRNWQREREVQKEVKEYIRNKAIDAHLNASLGISGLSRDSEDEPAAYEYPIPASRPRRRITVSDPATRTHHTRRITHRSQPRFEVEKYVTDDEGDDMDNGTHIHIHTSPVPSDGSNSAVVPLTATSTRDSYGPRIGPLDPHYSSYGYNYGSPIPPVSPIYTPGVGCGHHHPHPYDPRFPDLSGKSSSRTRERSRERERRDSLGDAPLRLAKMVIEDNYQRRALEREARQRERQRECERQEALARIMADGGARVLRFEELGTTDGDY